MHLLGKLYSVLKNTLQWNSDCMLQNLKNQTGSYTKHSARLCPSSVGPSGLVLFIIPHVEMCWKSHGVKSELSPYPAERFIQSLLSFHSIPKKCLVYLFVTGLNLGNMQYTVSGVYSAPSRTETERPDLPGWKSFPLS